MERLVPGQVYFIVVFNDEDLKVPLVQTLIFVKDGQRNDGTECHLFRQLSAQDDESDFFVDKKDARDLLLDHDALLVKLRRCFEGTLAAGSP